MPSRDDQANSGHPVSHETITHSVNENDETIVTHQTIDNPPSPAKTPGRSQANIPLPRPANWRLPAQPDTPQLSVTKEQFARLRERWDNWEIYFRAKAGEMDNAWFEDRITDEEHSRRRDALFAEYDALKKALDKAIAERKAARSRDSVVVSPSQQCQHVAASQAQGKHAGSDQSTNKMPGGWYED